MIEYYNLMYSLLSTLPISTISTISPNLLILFLYYNKMGNFFYFISGSILGIYLAQTYHLPEVSTAAVEIIKYIESMKKENPPPP
jgi:hypothetical protein